jgi:hypothetical protein
MTRLTRSVGRSFEEQDAFAGWRRVLIWQRGELKRAKRRANKRERREARQQVSEQLRD